MPTRLFAAAAAALFVSSAHAATVESLAGYAGPVGGYLPFDRAGLVFSGTVADLNVYPPTRSAAPSPTWRPATGSPAPGSATR